jgi:probable addiction module antidote protein/putative addiction module killer protein
MTTFLLTIRSL